MILPILKKTNLTICFFLALLIFSTKGMCGAILFVDSQCKVWDNGQVYYKVVHTNSRSLIIQFLDNIFFESCNEWSMATDSTISCNKMSDSEIQTNYVEINDGGKLSATIGMQGIGKHEFNYSLDQILKFSDSELNSTYPYNPDSRVYRLYWQLVHEWGHVIGMIHEHQREDAGSHVRIKYELLHEKVKDYWKKNKQPHKILTEYDVESIMHYPSFPPIPHYREDLRDSKPPLITTVNNELINVKRMISSKDAQAVKEAYKETICPCPQLSVPKNLQIGED